MYEEIKADLAEIKAMILDVPRRVERELFNAQLRAQEAARMEIEAAMAAVRSTEEAIKNGEKK